MRKLSTGLRIALAAAVIVPTVGVVCLALYAVHGSNAWAATDASGFGLCGMFGFVPVAVGVTWLSVRVLVRPDGELYALLAGVCWLGAGLMTIALGEAVAVAVGIREGRLFPDLLAGIAVTWTYLIALGVGHWYWSRMFPWKSLSNNNQDPAARD